MKLGGFRNISFLIVSVAATLVSWMIFHFTFKITQELYEHLYSVCNLFAKLNMNSSVLVILLNIFILAVLVGNYCSSEESDQIITATTYEESFETRNDTYQGYGTEDEDEVEDDDEIEYAQDSSVSEIVISEYSEGSSDFRKRCEDLISEVHNRWKAERLAEWLNDKGTQWLAEWLNDQGTES